MIVVLVFVFQLFILYLLSKILSKEASHFLFKITRNKKFSVYFLSFLFLPGTLIHELSHYVVAHVLAVKTGAFTLIPKMQSDSVVLGSVGIAKTDPIRRFFIGIAPFLVGTALILTGVHFFFAQKIMTDIPGIPGITITFICGYLVFVLSNTMFSSKKDMEGALELLAIVFFIVLTGYLLGVRVPAIHINAFLSVIEKAVRILLIPLAIDSGIFILAKILNAMLL